MSCWCAWKRTVHCIAFALFAVYTSEPSSVSIPHISICLWNIQSVNCGAAYKTIFLVEATVHSPNRMADREREKVASEYVQRKHTNSFIIVFISLSLASTPNCKHDAFFIFVECDSAMPKRSETTLRWYFIRTLFLYLKWFIDKFVWCQQTLLYMLCKHETCAGRRAFIAKFNKYPTQNKVCFSSFPS